MKQTNDQTRKRKKLLNYVNLFFLTLTISTFTSCKDDFLENNISTAQDISSSSLQRQALTGDSLILENPYTVENMTRALKSVKAENPNYNIEDFEVRPSHLYLKFTPRTEEEVGLLKQDSTIHYFDYRLDAEYREGFLEDRAKLAEMRGDSITTYYTALPIDKQLPNVPHEIISELYIPEQDSYFSTITDIARYPVPNKVSNSKTDLFYNLIFKAFEQTGNEQDVLTDDSTPQARWIFGSKWRPKGRITITDNCGGRPTTIGVDGAQILMRQWFTVDNGITDANGYFQTGTVRGKAKYVIQWERYNYSIRSGNFGQAETHGPDVKNQDWNYNLASGVESFYGNIHRAAFHYYYKDIKGLRRPPLNGFWKPQMKIGAFNQTDPNTNGNYRCWARFLGILPAIRIYNPNRSSCEIYGTTIHELAHSSHFNMNKQAYRNTENNVTESWARGVQWDLTRIYYPNYKNDYFVTDKGIKYTGVVEDMLDNNGYYGNNPSAVPENVSGYTIKQVEDALNGKTSWNSWRDNVKNLYNNPTKNNLNNVFYYWENF